jgi:hypothetical protein
LSRRNLTALHREREAVLCGLFVELWTMMPEIRAVMVASRV